MTSTAQLQREADAARLGLADTLGQLREGVAPSALSSEAIALLRDSGLSIVKGLADQARANPVPALLIGAGITMLLTRTTGSDVMGVASSTLKSASATVAGAAASAASGAATAAKSAAATVASNAATAARGVAASAADAAGAVGGRVAETVGSARSTIAGTVSSAREGIAGTLDSAREGMTSTARSAGESATSTLHRAGEALHQARGSAAAQMQSGVESGSELLEEGRQQAGQLASQVSVQAQTMMDDARQSLARLIEEQPILMAALGAALGGAIGALLPLSQTERDALGQPGAKALGAGRTALSNAASVVRQEMSSADIGARMGQIADKVVQNVTKDIGNPLGATSDNLTRTGSQQPG
jgi:hypothetical protein